MDYEKILKEKIMLERENRRLKERLEQLYNLLGDLQKELKEIKQKLRTINKGSVYKYEKRTYRND